MSFGVLLKTKLVKQGSCVSSYIDTEQIAMIRCLGLHRKEQLLVFWYASCGNDKKKNEKIITKTLSNTFPSLF